jgi:hypothetical protein
MKQMEKITKFWSSSLSRQLFNVCQQGHIAESSGDDGPLPSRRMSSMKSRHWKKTAVDRFGSPILLIFCIAGFGESIAPVFSCANSAGIICKPTSQTSLANWRTEPTFEFTTAQKPELSFQVVAGWVRVRLKTWHVSPELSNLDRRYLAGIFDRC